MIKVFKIVGFLAAIFLVACQTDLPDEVAVEYKSLPDHLDFNMDVKPILSDKCFLCHGPDEAKREADLRLDEPTGAFAKLVNSPDKVAIQPGNLKQSEVYHRILSTDPETVMPSPESNLQLTAREKAVLIKWIKDGAQYKPHWAFLPPEAQNPPKVKRKDWVKNPIDQFIAKKLENENLRPSDQAAKEILLRRVSFDLTGLPPTEAEISTFLADQSPDAYEKQVDRLLTSPHYGEKMATDWMDLARYSDTHGYTVDFYRDVSPWRDWVIQSFNENMSYDDFIEWQLAGDLMPNPSKEQILATTFNRLHPQNLEDGIVDEEFRVEYVVDRTSVLGTAFMGLTVACARCHDHKYDPISQKNFYELYGFFNNINEAGLIARDLATPVPTLLLPSKEQEGVVQYLKKVVAEKEQETVASTAQEEVRAKQWIAEAAYQKAIPTFPRRNLVAQYSLDRNLRNALKTGQVGKMDRAYTKGEKPKFVPGFKGQGLHFHGDAWLDLDPVGIFQRKDPFSIGLWVNVPDSLQEGVFFHKGKGTGLHAYRGYHLYLKDNKLELLLAHTAPDNAIIERTIESIPRDEWIHLMLTYDGSSQASGLKVYLNGREMRTKIVIDNLYKDIIFFNYEDPIYPAPIEPGLQIGGRWRGVGVKGALVDEVLVYDRELTAIEALQLGASEAAKRLIAQSPDQLNVGDQALLKDHYLSTSSSVLQQKQKDLQEARANLYHEMEDIQEIMVMKEMETPRQTYILERGLYDAYGEEVFPAVPNNLLPWPDTLPKNRLGLAKWLTHPDHPLTARVAVNRYWQNYFGQGIVRTSEDFGNQGELPSHPELLDWLALWFMDSDWDVKGLQKLIVMSATYQQTSLASKGLLERDPENLLLARGPKGRLSSEMLRDNALAASGLLNPKIGGESVRPYQPPGLWKMNSNTYVQDTGANLYRRSLYTLWKRTVPNPTLFTFDQPERSECTVRRQKTNTPLQALVLLNDPTYLEAAKVIGESITKEGSNRQSLVRAYKRITGKDPSPSELDIFQELQASEYRIFKEDHRKIKGWLAAGAYTIDPNLEAERVAANAIVASVMLNSEASITKR